ncbi:hypothetical protein J2T17_004698 [Paenibacillus mucilaginosus]|uniref:hypothetical protein n=1 Tax=Paenibacillus mucilaginosus TaxID=61624 RepID=UPI003D222D82
MNKEVTEILNKLEALSPSKRELNDIGSLLVQFISKQFDALTENSSAVTGMQLPSSGPFIERRKKETEAILEIRMIMMRKKSADKRKQSRWEIFKLVFSSAFGAAVTWVVKSYLGG